MVPLKFKLAIDCKYLSTMYKAVVLLTWNTQIFYGQGPETDNLKLDRIHIDGMRLVKGATAKSR